MSGDQDMQARIMEAQEVLDERAKLMKTCPVRPLGHRNGVYFFLSPVGELIHYSHKEFSPNGITSLFVGDIEWLKQKDHFPRFNKDGEIVGFAANNTAAFLMACCRDQGLFDSTIPIHGVGTWLSRMEDGTDQLIIHSGDLLWTRGQYQPAGAILGRAIYPAAPKVQRIADQAAKPADGQALLKALGRWNYGRPDIDPVLILGFIAQGMLGGAPDWRAHLLVRAENGSGKSALAALVTQALGGSAHAQNNDFSEAGLRQSMTEQARVMILDEAEAKENGRVAAVVEMIRKMSGGGGLRAVRGSQGGEARSFTLTGAAYLSAILPPPLMPQDRSRITEIKLHALVGGKDTAAAEAKLKDDLKAIGALSAAFRRRMIDLWPVFKTNVSSYRAAIVERGLAPRSADQLATLLAGKEIMLNDSAVVSDQIDADLELIAELTAQVIEERSEGEGELCLNHLYSSPLDVYRHGDRKTVGQVMAEAIKSGNTDTVKNANAQLGLAGIKLVADKFKVVEVIVATRHVGLDKIFSGTRWAGGGWNVLDYLGGGKAPPLNYAGAKSRGVKVPEANWPKGDDDDAQPRQEAAA